MRNATREISWTHVDDNDEATEIGEVKFAVAFPRAESLEDAVKLCGDESRLFDLLEQKSATFINPWKKKFLEAKSEGAARQVIAQAIEAGLTTDLIAGQRGVNPKAVKLDAIEAVLMNPSATREEKLAALKAQGYDI